MEAQFHGKVLIVLTVPAAKPKPRCHTVNMIGPEGASLYTTWK